MSNRSRLNIIKKKKPENKILPRQTLWRKLGTIVEEVGSPLPASPDISPLHAEISLIAPDLPSPLHAENFLISSALPAPLHAENSLIPLDLLSPLHAENSLIPEDLPSPLDAGDAKEAGECSNEHEEAGECSNEHEEAGEIEHNVGYWYDTEMPQLEYMEGYEEVCTEEGNM